MLLAKHFRDAQVQPNEFQMEANRAAKQQAAAAKKEPSPRIKRQRAHATVLLWHVAEERDRDRSRERARVRELWQEKDNASAKWEKQRKKRHRSGDNDNDNLASPRLASSKQCDDDVCDIFPKMLPLPLSSATRKASTMTLTLFFPLIFGF